MEQGLSNVIAHILSVREGLNDSILEIADFVIANPRSVLEHTTKELAEIIGTSEATIVRFCKRLGFSGYKEFKIKLAQDLGNEQAPAVPIDMSPFDRGNDVVKKVLQTEAENIMFTMEMLNHDVVEEVLDYIADCNKLAFFGVGSSSLVALTAKEHFLHYGKSVTAEVDDLSQILVASLLGPKDLAFAISISGRSKTPIKAIEIASKAGAKTVCLTQDIGSPLAKVSDKVIQVYRKSYYSGNDLGTVSRIAHVAVIDALAVSYAAKHWDKLSESTLINQKNISDYLYGTQKHSKKQK